MRITCNLIIIKWNPKISYTLNPTEKSTRRTWYLITCVTEKEKKYPVLRGMNWEIGIYTTDTIYTTIYTLLIPCIQ